MKKILVSSIFLYILIAFIGTLNPLIVDFIHLDQLKYPMLILANIQILIILISKSIKIYLNGQIKIIIVFIFILIFSSFMSVDILVSGMKSIMALLNLIMILGSTLIFGKEKMMFYIKKIIILFSLFILITSDIAIYLDEKVLFYFQGNFKGIFYNSNFLGGFIGLFSIIFIIRELFGNDNTKFKKIIYFSILLNLFFILWNTRSRAAILAFVVALSYIYLYKYIILNKKRVNYVFTAFGILLIIAIIVANNSNYFLKYILKYHSDSSVTATRSMLWRAHLNAIPVKPFFGWGYCVNPLSYDKAMKMRYEGLVDVRKGNTEKGNTLIAIVEEFGSVTGTFIIILLTYLFIWILLKINKNNVNDDILFMNGIILAALVHVNFESWLTYFGNIYTIFFWYLIIIRLSSEQCKNIPGK